MGHRRIWWGLGVMLVGICAALPLRRNWHPEASTPDETFTERAVPLNARPALPTKLTQLPAQEPATAVAAIVPSGDLQPLLSAFEPVPTRTLAKVDETSPLPSLATDYSAQVEDDSRSAVLGAADASAAIVEQADRSWQPRRYRIGKYDTLEAIAERLLGSRQHADKLLAANPDVIRVPEVLPVGATIVIPDIDQATETLVRIPQPRD